MTMDKAIEILGINRTRNGDLLPMIRALELLGGFFNSVQENERLKAARFVTRHWQAYQAACNAYRDKRGKS